MPKAKKTIEIEKEVKVTKPKTTKPKTTTKKKRDIEEIMAEKEEKFEENKLSALEQRRLERKKQMEMVKNIDDNLPILVYCNAGNSTIVYDCPKTMTHYEMRYGDFEYMTFMELKIMKSQHVGMLENYILIPMDVNSEDYTIEDVLKILKIGHLYGEEMLIDGNIDYIINDSKLNMFKSLLEDALENKKAPYVQLIIDRAIELAKKGEFTDYSKMNYLEEIAKSPDMFRDAIENYQTFE